MKNFNEYQYNVLKQDTLFSKIPIVDHQILINMAQDVVMPIISDYESQIRTHTLKSWFENNHGVKFIRAKEIVSQDRKIYGSFHPKENTIYLYERTIDKFPICFTPNTLEFVGLHEIYHVIERIRKIDYSELYQVTIFKFGPFKLCSSLQCLSELSANAFAKIIQTKGYMDIAIKLRNK